MNSPQSRDLIVQQLLQALMAQRMGNLSTPTYHQLTQMGAPDLPARAGRSLQGLAGSIRPETGGRNDLDRMAALPGQLASNTMDFWGSLAQLREPQISAITDSVTRGLMENLQPASVASPFTNFPFNTVGAQRLADFIGRRASESDAPLDLAETLQLGDVLPGLGAGMGILGRKSLDDLMSDASLRLDPQLMGPLLTGSRISQRYPTGRAATENPLTDLLTVDLEAVRNAPVTSEGPLEPRLAGEMAKYRTVGTNLDFGNIEEIFEDFKNYSTENLMHLYHKMPPEMRERAVLWYDGANNLANVFSEAYEIPVEASAAVLAALSPQMDWFKNVALAERVIDTALKHSHMPFTDDMYRMAEDIFINDPKKSAKSKKENRWIMDYIRGKSLDDLSVPPTDLHKGVNHNRIRGMWLRMMDEVYRPDKSYRYVSPEGSFLHVSPNKLGWGSNDDIGKAIAVLFDPSIENISAQMGKYHKVRNFYNNIVDPNAKIPTMQGDVTIDTHAVGAAQFMPYSASSAEVKSNLQGPPTSGPAGIKGAYPVNAEMYRIVADNLGLPPRMLQSVTWEQIKSLFSPEIKRKYEGKQAVPSFSNEVNALQDSRRRGDISNEEYYAKMEDLFGGYDEPEWVNYGPRGEPLRQNMPINPRHIQTNISKPQREIDKLREAREAITPEEDAANLLRWAGGDMGNVREMYHGSGKAFKGFSRSKSPGELGIHMGQGPLAANDRLADMWLPGAKTSPQHGAWDIAGQRVEPYGEKNITPNVGKYLVRAENPLVLDVDVGDWTNHINVKTALTNAYGEGKLKTPPPALEVEGYGHNVPKDIKERDADTLREYLKSEGYDSIEYPNQSEGLRFEVINIADLKHGGADLFPEHKRLLGDRKLDETKQAALIDRETGNIQYFSSLRDAEEVMANLELRKTSKHYDRSMIIFDDSAIKSPQNVGTWRRGVKDVMKALALAGGTGAAVTSGERSD